MHVADAGADRLIEPRDGALDALGTRDPLHVGIMLALLDIAHLDQRMTECLDRARDRADLVATPRRSDRALQVAIGHAVDARVERLERSKKRARCNQPGDAEGEENAEDADRQQKRDSVAFIFFDPGHRAAHVVLAILCRDHFQPVVQRLAIVAVGLADLTCRSGALAGGGRGKAPAQLREFIERGFQLHHLPAPRGLGDRKPGRHGLFDSGKMPQEAVDEILDLAVVAHRIDAAGVHHHHCDQRVDALGIDRLYRGALQVLDSLAEPLHGEDRGGYKQRRHQTEPQHGGEDSRGYAVLEGSHHRLFRAPAISPWLSAILRFSLNLQWQRGRIRAPGRLVLHSGKVAKHPISQRLGRYLQAGGPGPALRVYGARKNL